MGVGWGQIKTQMLITVFSSVSAPTWGMDEVALLGSAGDQELRRWAVGLQLRIVINLSKYLFQSFIKLWQMSNHHHGPKWHLHINLLHSCLHYSLYIFAITVYHKYLLFYICYILSLYFNFALFHVLNSHFTRVIFILYIFNEHC